MHFRKKLKRQIEETLPEWQDKYICYKNLKQLVRLISSAPSSLQGATGDSEYSRKAEKGFLYLLDNEIEKFNSFFMEQEEEFIIRHWELQQRIQRVVAMLGPSGSEPSAEAYEEEMRRIRNDIVNFHGEMVLLQSYSNINYTGLAKILKKYDKRTGALLQLRFIQKVLHQPFFATDLLSQLVKDCESTIDAVFQKVKEMKGEEKSEQDTTNLATQSILRSTVAALVTMEEMRRGSST